MIMLPSLTHAHRLLLISIIFTRLKDTSCLSLLREQTNRSIFSGVPFSLRLEGNYTLNSSIPECMRWKACKNEPFARVWGLCAQCDFRSSSSPVNVQQASFKVILLRNLQLQGTIIVEILFTVYDRLSSDIALDETLHFSDHKSCNKHKPTVILLGIDAKFCSEALEDRLYLWNIVHAKFNLSYSYHQTESTFGSLKLKRSNYGLRLLENINQLYNQLRPLTSSIPKRSNFLYGSYMGLLWQIGCGIVETQFLSHLVSLEKQFRSGPLTLEKFHASDQREDQAHQHHKIIAWLVGDLLNTTTSNGQKRAQISQHNNRRIRAISNYPEYPDIFNEGSGMLPSGYMFTGPEGTDTRGSTIHPDKENSLFPPIKVTVHQITNFQIPSKYLKSIDSMHNLRLSLFHGAKNTSVESHDKSVFPLGEIIMAEPNDWIVFDPDKRIIRLRPQPSHVGMHQVILCITADQRPQTCEPINIMVQRPSPFRKNFILRIPPGIYWCYQVPIYWFEELKVNSFDKMALTVEGDAPFSWDMETSTVCVVTMLKAEQLISLYFHASASEIAQSVEVEFRLSTENIRPQSLITQSRLRLTLQWPNQLKTYKLEEVNRINATLAHALRVRANPQVTANQLFIYDIIQFFTSSNEASPAILSLEWLFLPYGLWSGDDIMWNTDIHDESGSIHQIPRIGTLSGQLTNLNHQTQSAAISLSVVLKRCQTASLEGAELALKAAEDSFHPFILKDVHLTELENSACSKAKRFAESSVSEHEESSRVNVQMMPEVIKNFTVMAGVSFRKMIDPGKATSVKRIQFMELIDIHGVKLDDSYWIGLTIDNSHLFGLPLKQHIRKQPYLFGLQIYSVDQKTPITVGFTVEVLDWFDSEIKYHQPDQIIPNHRVRLRILPQTLNNNWSVDPINSLDYRWHLASALDKFLRPSCEPPCSPDVGIWEMIKHDTHSIMVKWAQLSILLENNRKSPSLTKVHSECPWESVGQLQTILTFAPTAVSMKLNNRLVTGYTRDQQIYLSPWSAPSAALHKHLANWGLGTAEAAVVDRMGICAQNTEMKNLKQTEQTPSGLDKNLEINNSSLLSEPMLVIYTGEGFRYKLPLSEQLKAISNAKLHLFDITGQRIGSSHWIGLEPDEVTVYGIVIGNTVRPITYRFRIATHAESEQIVAFSVHIAGLDPSLPAVHNHRVVMRFGTDGDAQWTGGHSLLDRWRLVSSIDTFLRPHCPGNPQCLESMDVLLLTFNYQAQGFTVIWAQKSVLSKRSTDPTSSTSDKQQLGLTEHKQHWDKWINSQWSSKNRRRFLRDGWNDLSSREVMKSSAKSTDIAGCPDEDLHDLEKRLLGDAGHGLLPLPELAQHLRASGVGVLKDVQVERLGPCMNSLANPQLFIPNPVTINTDKQNIYSPYEDVWKTSPANPIGPSNHQKIKQWRILLGTILPICIGLILILLGTLGLVWYRKRANRNLKFFAGQSHGVANPNTESELKLSTLNKGKNKQIGNTQANKLTSSTLTRTPLIQNNVVTIEDKDSSGSPPTNPVILPHEQIIFQAPEYNLGYTDTRTNMYDPFNSTMPPQRIGFLQDTQPVAMPLAGINMGQPGVFYGLKPNPYRNLPPPIETRPGMPHPASQIPYAPYKKLI